MGMDGITGTIDGMAYTYTANAIVNDSGTNSPSTQHSELTVSGTFRGPRWTN